LVYRLDERGKVSVTLRNRKAVAQAVRLVVRVENGLAHSETILDKEVEVGAPASAKATEEVEVPLPRLPEYGHAVVAELFQGKEVVGRKAEYFFVTNRVLQVGQYGAMPRQIWDHYVARNPDGQALQVRRTYFPIIEVMFWAPCDFSMLTSPAGKDRWIPCQSPNLRYSTRQLKEYVRAAHAQGMKVCAYVDYNWVFGWRIWDLWRRHPDWAEWSGLSPRYSVKEFRWQRHATDQMMDAALKKGVNTGECRPIPSHPGAMKFHADQLVESMKVFGWDGYRYDCWSPWHRITWDLFGRLGPFEGWTHAAINGYFRKRVREVKADAFIGHNCGWPYEGAWLDYSKKEIGTDHEWMPDGKRKEDPHSYVAMIRDGGFGLGEHVRWIYKEKIPWKEWADECVRGGIKAYRLGGEQYVILPGLRGSEGNYLLGLALAAGLHVAYSVREEHIPYLRLACRFCELLYGDKRHFPAEPEKLLGVDAQGRELWWRDYVRYRATAPGRRIYYVHLFNPPRVARMGDPGAAPPDPVRDVKLVWSLPDGWQPVAASHLTADLGDDLRYPLRLEGTSVTVPEVRRWSIVAVECRGPADAPEPEERLELPPAPSPPMDRIVTERVAEWEIELPPGKPKPSWATPRPEEVKAERTALRKELGVADAKAPLIWYGNGMYYEYFRLEEAFRGWAAALRLGDHALDGKGEESKWEGVPFPDSPAKLMVHDLVILANVPFAGGKANHYNEVMARSIIKPAGLEAEEEGRADTIRTRARCVCFSLSHCDWLREYVNAGGRLMVLGGPYSFGPGGWHKSALAEVLPVTVSSFHDLQPVGADILPWTNRAVGERHGGRSDPVPLKPVSATAELVDWTARPVLTWQHVLKAKPGAVVHVAAAGNPVIVTGSYGKGKVAVVTAAPLGEAPKDALAFWDWPGWPKLIRAVAKRLLE